MSPPGSALLCDERRPARVAGRLVVAVVVALANRRDRPPEVVVDLAVPDRDAGIRRREVREREQAAPCRRGRAAGRSPRRAAPGSTAAPKLPAQNRAMSVSAGAGHAPVAGCDERRALLLDLVVILRVAVARHRRRRARAGTATGSTSTNGFVRRDDRRTTSASLPGGVGTPLADDPCRRRTCNGALVVVPRILGREHAIGGGLADDETRVVAVQVRLEGRVERRLASRGRRSNAVVRQHAVGGGRGCSGFRLAAGRRRRRASTARSAARWPGRRRERRPAPARRPSAVAGPPRGMQLSASAFHSVTTLALAGRTPAGGQ